jgi:hypothetical protein
MDLHASACIEAKCLAAPPAQHRAAYLSAVRAEPQHCTRLIVVPGFLSEVVQDTIPSSAWQPASRKSAVDDKNGVMGLTQTLHVDSLGARH